MSMVDKMATGIQGMLEQAVKTHCEVYGTDLTEKAFKVYIGEFNLDQIHSKCCDCKLVNGDICQECGEHCQE